MRGAGQLPITIDLHPDESLESFLERTAQANQIPTPALMAAIVGAVPALVVRFARLTPHPTLVTAVGRITGLDPVGVRLASLARFDGGLPLNLAGLDHARPAGHRAVAARGWLQPRTTQICPPCLAEDGIWRVGWRLHTSIACPRHQVLLVATCPGCGRRFRDGPHGLMRPHLEDLGRCGNPIGGHATCPQILGELAAVPATAAHLSFQAAHDHAITTAGNVVAIGRAVTPPSFLAAARSLAVLTLHLHQPEPGRRWALAPPPETEARAEVLTIAHRILTLGSLDQAARELRLHLARIPATTEGRADWVGDHMGPSRLAAEIVERALHPQRRLAHQLRTQHGDHRLPVAAIPQVMPLETYRHHLGAVLKVTDDVGRAFASLALATFCTGAGWSEAGALLGYPPGFATRLARTVHQRTDTTSLPVLLRSLAIALDPAVDYRDRERSLRDLVDHPDWFDNWVRVWRPGTRPTSRPFAQTWAWTHAARGHLSTSPAWELPPTVATRAAYRQFATSLSAPAAAALANSSPASGWRTQ